MNYKNKSYTCYTSTMCTRSFIGEKLFDFVYKSKNDKDAISNINKILEQHEIQVKKGLHYGSLLE